MKFTIKNIPKFLHSSRTGVNEPLFKAFKALSNSKCIIVKVKNDCAAMKERARIGAALCGKFGAGTSSVRKHRINDHSLELIITKK